MPTFAYPGVPHGDALVRFGEAVTRGAEDLDQARADLLHALGPEGFVEAAGIVGIFNGPVRTLDATGISLDDGRDARCLGRVSAETRARSIPGFG